MTGPMTGPTSATGAPGTTGGASPKPSKPAKPAESAKTPKTTKTTETSEGARLAAALRELKARTGLSLVGLEKRTPYSKSSWERYLNGKTLPPRQAVQELCRLAREPAGRCLALWEFAEAEARGRARKEPPPAPSPPTPPPSAAPASSGPAATVEETARADRKGAAAALLAAVCAVAAGAVALAFFLLPHPDGAAPRPSPSVLAPLCRGAACEGGDPMTTHCGAHPANLAFHHTATGAGVEIRFSTECGTGWARMWDTRVGDRLEVTASGRTRSVTIENGTEAMSYIYTPMLVTRPGTVLRACFRPAAGGRTECVTARVAAARVPATRSSG
jgi:hypothetical protein